MNGDYFLIEVINRTLFIHVTPAAVNLRIIKLRSPKLDNLNIREVDIRNGVILWCYWDRFLPLEMRSSGCCSVFNPSSSRRILVGLVFLFFSVS